MEDENDYCDVTLVWEDGGYCGEVPEILPGTGYVHQRFSLNLTIIKENFIFEHKALATSSWQKKKKSPNQLRREAKQKEELENIAAEEVTNSLKTTVKVVITVSEEEEVTTVALNYNAEDVVKFKCDQCDYDSIT